MPEKNCTNGFHGSLAESLAKPEGCPTCGRNYDYETFLKTCKAFNINPGDRGQVEVFMHRLTMAQPFYSQDGGNR